VLLLVYNTVIDKQPNGRMTEFYVIMSKRHDGKVYADLHKTDQHIYLTIEDAKDEFNKSEHYKEYYHIVKLIACLEDEIKELESED
jgi:hypothetical protein